MNELPNRSRVLYRLASLLLAIIIVAAAACSSGGSSRDPFVDADGDVDGATTDAAAEARGDAAVVEGGSDDCSGVKCRADQICLQGCSASGDTSCFLSIEPKRVCVDLPSGCTRANACDCAPYSSHCPISGRGFTECYDDGADAIKCICGCRF